MKILFRCTANSCRSQMAESWAKRLFPADWSVASCGLVTYPIVPETRAALEAVGLDMEGQESQSLDAYDLEDFDLIVTLSGQSSKFLPPLKDPSRHVRYPVRDPMSFRGPSEEVAEAFRKGCERIRQVVQDLVDGKLTSKQDF